MSCWFKDWPNEPGNYWFFGYRSNYSSSAALYHVQVRKIVTGPIYIADGHFLCQAEGARGLWLPKDVPEVPTLEQLAELVGPPNE